MGGGVGWWGILLGRAEAERGMGGQVIGREERGPAERRDARDQRNTW